MGKKNKLSTPKSKCCYAEIKIGGLGDFHGEDRPCTIYYMCTKCGKACDVIIMPRRTWKRNPKTQIVPNKKKKKSTKLTPKELKEIHRNEDF